MELPKIKKRYVIGVGIIALLLWKCSGPSDEELAQQRWDRAADAARYQANQDAESIGQPQPYAQRPPHLLRRQARRLSSISPRSSPVIASWIT